MASLVVQDCRLVSREKHAFDVEVAAPGAEPEQHAAHGGGQAASVTQACSTGDGSSGQHHTWQCGTLQSQLPGQHRLARAHGGTHHRRHCDALCMCLVQGHSRIHQRALAGD